MSDECECTSCRRTLEYRAGKPCGACNGEGKVPSITGVLRPCSRCQPAAFDDWCAAQRPQASYLDIPSTSV